MTAAPAAPARWMDHLPLDAIAGAGTNPKTHAEERLAASIGEFGFADALIYDERTGRIVAGHGRLDSLREARAAGEAPPEGVAVGPGGEWLVPVQRGWASASDEHARAFLIAHNRLTELGGWDDAELLAELTALDDAGLLAAAAYDTDELAALAEYAGGDGGGGEGGGAGDDAAGPGLADRFLIPPFDVLDARQGWWRERKAAWLSLGLRSELGRGGMLVLDSLTTADPHFYDQKRAVCRALGRELTTEEFIAEHYTPDPDNPVTTGTSIFDPVLAELAVRWFSPPGGEILDPFAGGSVRGLVAAVLGRRYTGNDLAAAQIGSNIEQAADFEARGLIGAPPHWTIGDSAEWVRTLPAESFDAVLTCPPYLWLERYGEDPADLSGMPAAAFEEAYTGILTGCAAALRPDRFAVIVVGDVRDPKTGALVDFRGMTIRAAAAAGLAYQSGGVLVTMAGSLASRAARVFESGRLLGRTHQDVLVFCKGDRRAAAGACGPVDVELPEAVADAFIPAAAPGTGGSVGSAPREDFTPDVTPVEIHGGYRVKRDDAWRYRGAAGAKSRTMIRLAREAGAAGIVSAGARVSPQLERAALAAEALGIPARLHTGAGKDTPELIIARAAGAEILPHTPARLSVIRARFRDDAAALPGWLAVPYGMDHPGYVADVAAQAAALPFGDFARIVVPAGSGMTLAGILAGLDTAGRADIPVLAVRVGGDPAERLDAYAPGWRDRVELVTSALPYEQAAPITALGDLRLDPIYEAKCLPYLRPGDLLWLVGIRASAE